VRFLADENIERPVIEFLRSKGHDVLAIAEDYTGAVDEDVLKIANGERRVLVTNDKDFGELVFLQKRISPGILLIRSSIEDSEAKIRLLKEVLQVAAEKISGNFVVVTEGGYRLRSL